MLLVALFSGMLVFVIFLVLIEFFSRGKTKITRKVRRYAGNMGATDYQEANPAYVDNFIKFIRYLGLKIRGISQTKVLEIKMQQAGWPLLGSEFAAVVSLMVLLATVFGMMLTMQWRYALLIGAASGSGCILYMNIHIARRRQDFSNQLGDVLSMISNAMRSGFSFMQAMDLIAKEMKPPVSIEFFKTIAEIRLGSSTETALLNMGKRAQSSDLDLVITAVLIQRQVGGNLAQILDTIGNTINDRIKMKREIKTLTAQGRLSSYVLGALPFLMAGFAMLVNPHYLQPIFDEPMGFMILGGGVIWQILGFLIIQKIVNIDV
jgi:tight adherence protein B